MLSTYYLVKLFNKATSERLKRNLKHEREGPAYSKPGMSQQSNNISKCRICLQAGIIPIYNEEEPYIAVDICTFADIEISEDDEYPKFICDSCHKLLKSAILFRSTAKQSDQILRNAPKGKRKHRRKPRDLKCAQGTAEEKAKQSALVLQNYFIDVGSENEISGDDSRPQRCMNRKKITKVQCTICFKIITKAYYKEHFALHDHSVANFVCDICGKSFRQRCTYRSHYFTHSSEFPFKCKLCPYRGRHSGLLKLHMRTHTGDYRYICTECPARFLTKSNLNKHALKHKEPMFHCDTCQRGFHSKLILERHFEAVHLGVKKHTCNVCGKAFGYRKAMMRHQLRVHKREKKGHGRTPAYIEAEKKTHDNNF